MAWFDGKAGRAAAAGEGAKLGLRAAAAKVEQEHHEEEEEHHGMDLAAISARIVEFVRTHHFNRH